MTSNKKSAHPLTAATAVFLLLANGAVMALSPAPPDPVAELAEFYQATGGDDWIRNDDWLDSEVPVCDWHGVVCNTDFGGAVFSGLSLPNNNLTGSINELELLNNMFDRLDLSGNRLSGTLEQIPFWITHVNLARNELAGTLPDIRAGTIIGTPPPDYFHGVSYLDLSGNDFHGAIPEDWYRMALSVLDLSNNSLDEGIENAFAAIGSGSGGELVLTDNAFSGSLPADVIDTNLWETDFPKSGGGLNLCWNDLTIDDPDLIAWIDEHHVAGPGWQICQNRDRDRIDASVSGTWFSPSRSGEGVSLMLLDDGSPLLYGFTYSTEAEQQWYFEVGRTDELFLDWPTLLETRGDFRQGLRVAEDPLIRNVASLRMDRLGDRVMQFERVFNDYSDCPPLQEIPEEGDPVPLPCIFYPVSDRMNQIQLTRLAGTTCDNQLEHQWISGVWFNPESTGEGFVVEVIEDGRGVVYWFTYAADGSGEQVWLTGDARFDGTTLIVDNLLQPNGATYGPSFDRDAVVLDHWGSLTLNFSDESSASANFDSVRENFGQGQFELERLANPMLAECD